jgi:hypothetical protein
VVDKTIAPDEIVLSDDLCKCGHIRSDHYEFVKPGCCYIQCPCRGFDKVYNELEILEGESSVSKRGEGQDALEGE